MILGYARTSTLDQVAGFEAQRRDLESAGCECALKHAIF
jgi:DNA invertase Pin-like site-specific DNA recombinase